MYIPLKPLFSRHKGIGVQFTDEPTGNLDSKTAMDVMLLLKQCNKEFNQTFLVITHDEKIAQMGCRTIHICDGNVYKL